ncbi:MAG: type II secretion system protein [Planctomycetota bacterium]
MKDSKRKPRFSRGLTLTELVVVLTILVALAGVTVPNLTSTFDRGRDIATKTSVDEVRDAVTQYWSDCKYVLAAQTDQRIVIGDLLAFPFAVGDEFDPEIGLGWRSPYLEFNRNSTYLVDTVNGFSTAYGIPSDFAVRDTFVNQDLDGNGVVESGSPIVIQEPTLIELASRGERYALGNQREVRVVSAGANGILEIDESLFDWEITPELQGDDIYVSVTLR